MPNSETRKGTYRTTVLKTTVEDDEPGPAVVEGGAPCVEVVDGVGLPAFTEVEVAGVFVTGG